MTGSGPKSTGGLTIRAVCNVSLEIRCLNIKSDMASPAASDHDANPR